MQLVLLHPEVAGRSCESCKIWWYDDPGDSMGSKVLRRPPRVGPPQRRPKASKPPCWKCPKQPDDLHVWRRRPETADQELTPKNLRAYLHYLDCKAVGQFPDDATVRRNAGLIRRVEDHVSGMRGDVTILAKVMVGMRAVNVGRR